MSLPAHQESLMYKSISNVRSLLIEQLIYSYPNHLSEIILNELYLALTIPKTPNQLYTAITMQIKQIRPTPNCLKDQKFIVRNNFKQKTQKGQTFKYVDKNKCHFLQKGTCKNLYHLKTINCVIFMLI